MPSHKTKEQLAVLGYPDYYHDGNDAADAEARTHAQAAAPPSAVVQQWKQKRSNEMLAMRVIANRQRDCLSKRARIGGQGQAAHAACKSWKRKQPALPAQLRLGKKQRRSKAPAVPVIDLADGLHGIDLKQRDDEVTMNLLH